MPNLVQRKIGARIIPLRRRKNNLRTCGGFPMTQVEREKLRYDWVPSLERRSRESVRKQERFSQN